MKIRIDPLDKLASLVVKERANWCCERCGAHHQRGSKGLHASHFWGRSKKSVRYDVDRNLNAICMGCHSFFHANPAEHHAWKLKQMGEREYKKLDIDAHLPQKIDKVFIKKHLELLLSELQENK